MKVAVNTRLLLKDKLEGIGTFMDETLKRITAEHPETEFHFFFDRKFDQQFVYGDNVIPHVVNPITRHALLIKFWFKFMVPRKMKKLDIKHIISPDSLGFFNSSITNHLVIHDINFVHRPEDLPEVYAKFYLKNMPIFAGNANQIGTVSNYSKQDLVTTYGLKPEKIDVVYNAAKAIFKPLSEEEKDKIKSANSHGKNYFLFVGSMHPRKNLPNLISAFFQFKKMSNASMKFLVVGNVMWETEGLKDLLSSSKYSQDIHFLGRKSDEQLAKILGAAFALSYVPFFEGFGIPIVEAFACETPVITSNTTCMPEVAGDAALMVNPHEIDEICGAMTTLYSNPNFRENLIEKGKIKCTEYSWEKTANLYWESIKKTF
jgi:glycosyltransferase involved in cell wall biosynthesis